MMEQQDTGGQPDADALRAELTALTKVVSMVNRLALSMDIDDAMDSVRDGALELLNCEVVSLFLVFEGQQELRAKAAPYADVIRVKFGEGIAGTVVRSGELMNVANAYEEPLFNPSIDKETGFRTRSILCCAITDGSGKTVAVLQVLNKRGGLTFTRSDEHTLRLVGTHIGNMLAKSRLHEQVQREKARLGALFNYFKLLSKAKDLGHVLATVSTSIMDVLHAEHSFVFIADAPRAELWMQCAVPDREEFLAVRVKVGEGLVGAAARDGAKCTIISNYAMHSPQDELVSSLLAPMLCSHSVRSLLVQPVAADDSGRVCAVILCINKRANRADGRADLFFEDEFTECDKDAMALLALELADALAGRSLEVAYASALSTISAPKTTRSVASEGPPSAFAAARRVSSGSISVVSKAPSSATTLLGRLQLEARERSMTPPSSAREHIASVDGTTCNGTTTLVGTLGSGGGGSGGGGLPTAFGHAAGSSGLQLTTASSMATQASEGSGSVGAGAGGGSGSSRAHPSAMELRSQLMNMYISEVPGDGSPAKVAMQHATAGHRLSSNGTHGKSGPHHSAPPRGLATWVRALNKISSLKLMRDDGGGSKRGGSRAIVADPGEYRHTDPNLLAHLPNLAALPQMCGPRSTPQHSSLHGSPTGEACDSPNMHHAPESSPAAWGVGSRRSVGNIGIGGQSMRSGGHAGLNVLFELVPQASGGSFPNTVAPRAASGPHTGPPGGAVSSAVGTSVRGQTGNTTGLGPHRLGSMVQGNGPAMQTHTLPLPAAIAGATSAGHGGVGGISGNCTGGSGMAALRLSIGSGVGGGSRMCAGGCDGGGVTVVPGALSRADVSDLATSAGNLSNTHSGASFSLSGPVVELITAEGGTQPYPRSNDGCDQQPPCVGACGASVPNVLTGLPPMPFGRTGNVATMVRHAAWQRSSTSPLAPPRLRAPGSDGGEPGSPPCLFIGKQVLSSWTYDFTDVGTNTLSKIAYDMFILSGVVDYFHLDITTLGNFLAAVASNYHDVPYHNFNHACHVLHAAWMALNCETAREVLTMEDTLGIMIAALCHDVDHDGRSNSYHVHTQSELARLYNDGSVMENHHCALTFDILRRKDCALLDNFDTETNRRLRKVIVGCIMCTDMVNHFTLTQDFCKHELEFEPESEADRLLLSKVILHAADIGSGTRPFAVCRKLSARVQTEFEALAGEEEALGIPVTFRIDSSDPMLANQAELNFLDYIVRPLWERMAEVLPELQPAFDCILVNRETYAAALAAAQDERSPTAAANGDGPGAAADNGHCDTVAGHTGEVAEAASPSGGGGLGAGAAAAGGDPSGGDGEAATNAPVVLLCPGVPCSGSGAPRSE
ncbi:hypothetical protein FOA52_012201 [Chlamydomonas sp. UWO 241]|nr:hypothetical protein FOA52_012201 [Chlamydomonas sp. UWO 241]